MGNTTAKHTYYAVKKKPLSDYPHPAAPCPFAWREKEIDGDLHELLFFAVPVPIGYDENCNERSPKSPFRHCGDEFGSGHVSYEGVFHGLAQTSVALDDYLHSRSHSLQSKPAAPLPVRAFLECFRRANAHWLFRLLPKQNPAQVKANARSSSRDTKTEHTKAKTNLFSPRKNTAEHTQAKTSHSLRDDAIKHTMPKTNLFCLPDDTAAEHAKAKTSPSSLGDVAKTMSPKTDVQRKPLKGRINSHCETKPTQRHEPSTIPDTAWLHSLCADGKAFADVAIRVHFGDQVPDTDVRWHVNTPHAALQLSLILEGSRYLHMERHKTSQPKSDDPPHERIEQDFGYVYISSPWVYEHGVEYPTSNDDDRIVMMHCQFLMSPDDYDRATAPAAQEGWGELMRLVAKRIAGASIKIPTFNQVLRMMSLLGAENI